MSLEHVIPENKEMFTVQGACHKKPAWRGPHWPNLEVLETKIIKYSSELQTIKTSNSGVHTILIGGKEGSLLVIVG